LNNYLIEWFNNINNNEINSNILLLCVKDRTTILNIKKYINDNYYSIIQIVPTFKLTKEIINSKNTDQKYIIAYCTKEFSFEDFTVFKNENMSIILMKINTPQQFTNCFSNSLNRQFIHYEILQKQNVRTVLSSLKGINFISSFISKFITINTNYCQINKESIQKFLYRNRSITIETILGDIDFLEHKFILTSRLAIFIYKICTFDYNASDKEIGLYFSKYYGRSKNFNNKNFGVKNSKGYAIGLNIQEEQIKLDIAKCCF